DANCAISSIGVWGSTFLSYAQWQAVGNDTHGITVSPQFSYPPSNLRPRTTSPVFGAGTNLSGVFLLDVDGLPLPSTGAWTMGAYQGIPIPPAPPSNLRIISAR